MLDNIDATWMSIGTYPIGENIQNLTEQPVTPTYVGHLSGSNIGIVNTGEYHWYTKVYQIRRPLPRPISYLLFRDP